MKNLKTRHLIVTCILGSVLMVGLFASVKAARKNIAPVSYSSVGTRYVTVTGVMADTSGGTLYVTTRPTTTTDAKLRIVCDGVTKAEKNFPYQTASSYLSASMSKNKLYNVQVRAVSGKVSGQVSGYYTY